MGCSQSRDISGDASVDKPRQTKPTSEGPDIGKSALYDPSATVNTGERDAKKYLNQNWIKWTELSVTGSPEQAIIGNGSFGTVIRATYKPRNLDQSGGLSPSNSPKELEVAVKVLTKTLAGTNNNDEFEQICDRAIEEVELIQDAAKSMVYSDCIVKAYGVARGPLPSALSSIFRVTPGDEGVGIIMRFEGGGSMEGLLKKTRDARQIIPMAEKIRLLRGVARGLAELHSIGLIHSDIKPENILLSNSNPPEVRLADFGLAIMKDKKDLTGSTMSQTKHLRGTPIYCAPEMLVNPYVDFEGTVAKSSRKTDMYAFAMLAWEVLSQLKPFAEITSEGVLCSRVHKGYRPSLDALPRDTPGGLVTVITSCWDKDRSKRKSAVEVFSLLNFFQGLAMKTQFDVFISHSVAVRPVLDHVIHHLTQFGYRVWYDQSDIEGDMSPDRMKSIKNIISNCKIAVACIDHTYQEDENCMFELRQARKIAPDKPTMALVMEENPLGWGNEEIVELCQLRSSIFVDIGKIATGPWTRDEGPDADMLGGLYKNLQPLLRLLNDAGCYSSVGGSQGKRNLWDKRM